MQRQVIFFVCLPFLKVDGLTRPSDISDDWPPRLVANYSADLILGALFPIHEHNNNFSGCGKIQKEDGIQALEATLYTLQKINQDGILPGFKLGLIALDSCDNIVTALDQSLEFIKGFIAKLNEHHEHQFVCGDGFPPKYRGGEYDRIVGVVGAQSSAVTIQVANLLRLFKVPQISYLSTTSTLSKREMFEYFFRTVPSDIYQAQCILEILGAFNWTYVSLVYSHTDYGSNGYEELQRLAPKYNVCFAFLQRVTIDDPDEEYDRVIHSLVMKTNARVVVVFTDKKTAHNLMAAAKRLQEIGRFVWIGSDGWSGRVSVTYGHEEVIEGAITVQPKVGKLEGFDDYFQSLTVENNIFNPWFEEFYEEYFQCKLDQVPVNPFNEKSPPCSTTRGVISVESGYKQQWYLHFIRDAVYAFAYSLLNMHKNTCHGVLGVCREMEERIEKHELKHYLENVTFKDESGVPFRFLKGGDALPRYSIHNYQKLSSGNYSWIRVGNYSLGEDGQPNLNINKSAVKFLESDTQFPASLCSEPCRPGQAKIQQDGDQCCWVCTNCSEYQYLHDFHCRDCPLGTLPTRKKDGCKPVPETFLGFTNPWAIGTIAVAALGIILTLSVGLIYWIYSDTPIIKAAGRELSFLLLIGIFLSFATSFLIVSKPTPVTCGLSRFLIGFCYTLCYAAIVTKTNRIARIFNLHHSTPHKAKYISPKSQLIITTILTTVEVVINGAWLLYLPPDVVSIHPTPEDNFLICSGADDASYLVGLVYPLVLIGSCTVYAFKTRKCPDGFNEARYIAFTTYTTCVVWLAFVPLFFASTSMVQRSVTLSLAMSLSGLVLVGCLFVPKLYIVLLKPEKNTKEGVMSQHRPTYVPSSSSLQQAASCSKFLNGSAKGCGVAVTKCSPTSSVKSSCRKVGNEPEDSARLCSFQEKKRNSSTGSNNFKSLVQSHSF